MNKLALTTKETLEADSDWYVLDESGHKVIANLMPRVEVVFKGIDLAAANDWVIVDGHSYTDATLVSADADVETKICRAFERQHPQHTTTLPFHYNQFSLVPSSTATASA